MFDVLSGSTEPCFKRGDILFHSMFDKGPPVSGDVAVFWIDGRDMPKAHRIHSSSLSWLNASFHDVTLSTSLWDCMSVMSTAAVLDEMPGLPAGSDHVIWPQSFDDTCSSITGLFVRTDGRRQLTTAATLRMHVEVLDKRHSALWRPHCATLFDVRRRLP